MHMHRGYRPIRGMRDSREERGSKGERVDRERKIEGVSAVRVRRDCARRTSAFEQHKHAYRETAVHAQSTSMVQAWPSCMLKIEKLPAAVRMESALQVAPCTSADSPGRKCRRVCLPLPLPVWLYRLLMCGSFHS